MRRSLYRVLFVLIGCAFLVAAAPREERAPLEPGTRFEKLVIAVKRA